MFNYNITVENSNNKILVTVAFMEDKNRTSALERGLKFFDRKKNLSCCDEETCINIIILIKLIIRIIIKILIENYNYIRLEM